MKNDLKMDYLSNMPKDMIQSIAFYLRINDVLRLLLTSKKIAKSINIDEKKIYENKYKAPALPHQTFKDSYLLRKYSGLRDYTLPTKQKVSEQTGKPINKITKKDIIGTMQIINRDSNDQSDHNISKFGNRFLKPTLLSFLE